ncbi:hypothetical protein GCM10022381_36610 [Leifsonia kafniensis]|uniref:Sigma-70 family RNA polymerase sigma factor n=1 Tax=Leifsonia kafniensis TaxID=475957 RepID=A0ABP7L000_9MICO
MSQRPPRSSAGAEPPHKLDEQGDSELVDLVREGNKQAFGVLWQRHAGPGKAVARAFSASMDPDDLVAESFTKIFHSIQSGKGPTTAFRAYLFTTIRNTAASWGRSSKESSTDELDELAGPTSLEDESLAALDRSLTATAFRSLPTRWQEVLWYTEVEGLTAQQVAPLLGMKANAVYALGFRAREGLRQAWIQAHISSVPENSECRWSIERLGGHARGALASRDQSRLDDHLAECNRCTIIASEAHEVGSRLALILLPLVAGVGGAAAYTAWNQTNGASSLLAALEPVGPPPAVVSASFAKPAKSLSTGATVALVAVVTLGLAGGAALIVPALINSASDEQTLAQTVDPPALAPTDETDAAAPEIAQPEIALPEITVPPVVELLVPPAPSEPVTAPNPPAPRPAPNPAPIPTAAPIPVPTPTSEPTPTPDPPVTPTPTPTPTAPPITPPTTPPVVPNPSVPIVNSPVADAELNTSTVNMSGTGAPGNTVLVTIEPPSAEGPFSATIDATGHWNAAVGPLPDGRHALTVVQSTPTGETSNPLSQSVTIDTVALPPTGTITKDPGDRFVPSLEGHAEANATVEVLNSAGDVIDETTADAAGVWAIDAVAGLGFGTQTIAVRQIDTAGNVSPLTSPKTVTLRQISIAWPLEGASVGTSVNVDIVGDPGIAFQALLDGVPTGNPHSINPDGTWSGRLTLPVGMEYGDHVLSVRYADDEDHPTRFGPEATVNFVAVDPADGPPSSSGPLPPA